MDERKNVIVIMVDQMKATASRLYSPHGCRTPNLERLARTGVTYDRAFTPAPICMPARVALWSARHPSDTGALLNSTPMPEGVDHGLKAFREAGYRTALIGKNHCFESDADKGLFDVLGEISHWGISKGMECRGLDWWRSPEEIAAGHRIRAHMGVPDGWTDARGMPVHRETFCYAHSDLPLEDYGTELISRQAERFIEGCDERPFLLWLSYPDPHVPWEAPQAYVDLVLREGLSLPPFDPHEFAPAAPGANGPRVPERLRVLKEILGVDHIDTGELRNLYAAYLAQIRFVDDGIGRVLDCLARTGRADSTIVVFCSDHGDFMIEHGMCEKGGAFFDCLTRVPLIVAAPGAPQPGGRCDALVSLIDVVPTLLHLNGLAPLASAQGEPLPMVAGGAGREAVFAEYGAGGPNFGMEDLRLLPQTRGRKAARATLARLEEQGLAKMVRTREWKLVYDPMAEMQQLYDLVSDPWEQRNVVEDPANAPVVAALAARLLDWHLANDRRPPHRAARAVPARILPG